MDHIKETLESEIKKVFNPPFIVHQRSNKGGMIVVLPEEKQVIKYFNDEKYAKCLEKEAKALSLIKDEFKKYFPRVIKHGLTSSNGYYLITDYCENRFKAKMRSEKFLLENFYSYVAPSMLKFYQSFPIEKINVIEWLSRIKDQVKDYPEKRLYSFYQKLCKQSSNYKGINLLLSQNHNDLHLSNTAMDEYVRIFDFEFTDRSLMLIDLIDPIRKHIRETYFLRRSFWQFMQKGIRLDKNIEIYVYNMMNWLSHNFNITLRLSDLRFLIQLYVLERCLLKYRTMGMIRIKDKNSFEARCLNLCL